MHVSHNYYIFEPVCERRLPLSVRLKKPPSSHVTDLRSFYKNLCTLRKTYIYKKFLPEPDFFCLAFALKLNNKNTNANILDNANQ